MNREQQQRLLTTALRLQFITREQVELGQQIQLYFQNQGKNVSLVKILIDKGFLSPDKLKQIQQQHLPTISLKSPPTATTEANTVGSSSSEPTTPVTSTTARSRYQIAQELGRGGMGKVYKAYDNELGRVVALKMLLTGGTASSIEVERFKREAKATANLRHPNIITLYDIGMLDEQPYFTMDFIEGDSLKVFLKNSSPSTRHIAEIMITIADTIEYAHQQGVIHRDLKPGNIMMRENKHPVIMDFGLAKTARASKKLSKTGTMMGTLQYMPPEQAEGRLREIDACSDVYALGAILYEMLTGQAPFLGTSYASLLNHVLNKAPIAPTRIKKRVPQKLEHICLKALEKKKEKRYQSAASFSKDLARFLQGEKLEAKPLAWYRRITRDIKQFQGAVAIVLLVILSALAFFMGKSSQSSPLSPKENSPPSSPEQPPSSHVPLDKEIWQSCWIEEDGLFDFSAEVWRKLPPEKQFAYAKKYQQWYAKEKNYRLSKVLSRSSTQVELVLVPPGRLIIQSQRFKEKKNIPITLNNPYYIGKYEVTQKQWRQVMEQNHSSFQGDQLPAEGMNWWQAAQFCDHLQLRLPTKNEWWYACSAGMTTDYNLGEKLAPNQVNNNSQSTTPVGTPSFPNAWGIYNMHGNVSEWSYDWESLTRREKYKIVHGGNWKKQARASHQWTIAGVQYRAPQLGLRVVAD